MNETKWITDQREKVVAAFGHLIASFGTDAHAGDSGDLALDTLNEVGLDEGAIAALEVAAEHVAGNYQYTGEADEFARRAERGEV